MDQFTVDTTAVFSLEFLQFKLESTRPEVGPTKQFPQRVAQFGSTFLEDELARCAPGRSIVRCCAGGLLFQTGPHSWWGE
jgi:hypothetical protein